MVMSVTIASLTEKVERMEEKFLQGVLGDNIVMEPLEGKAGEPACLIFIVGAYCE